MFYLWQERKILSEHSKSELFTYKDFVVLQAIHRTNSTKLPQNHTVSGCSQVSVDFLLEHLQQICQKHHTPFATHVYLLKRSFNSCSEQKGPRLATKSVEQGILFTLLWAAKDTETEFVVDDDVATTGPLLDTTPCKVGLASTGLGASCGVTGVGGETAVGW